jgi:glycosyltransferase involved in cell wall biosynthesis
MKRLPLISFVAAKLIQPIFNRNLKIDSSIDIDHFINMIPPKNFHQPYIIEFEHVGALMNFIYRGKNKGIKEALIAENCRMIICSSEAARNTLEEFMGRDYNQVSMKTKVVYPSIDRKLSADLKRQETDRSAIQLLFVGNDCLRKGFEELLTVVERLQMEGRKVYLNVVSNDADKIINEHPKIRNVWLEKPAFTKKRIIDDFFKKADVFVFPTRQDTFGYVLFDAMSVGLPVIATNQFAVKEIIEDGVDGWLLNLERSVLDEGYNYNAEKQKYANGRTIDKGLCKNLYNVLSEICDDISVLENYRGKAVHKFINDGKFSINTRNSELSKLYKQAIGNS